MPSNFTKQPQFLTAKYFNTGAGDTVIGGSLTGVPTNIGASAGDQTRPGDRLVLGAADALALSDPAVGTLYGGLYQYVTTALVGHSTSAPARANLAFWDVSVVDALYQVTADEDDVRGINLIAGVYINTLTKGNSWWIAVAGKVIANFRAVFTGAPATGCAVYAANAGAGADNGTLDVLDGGGNPTFTQVGDMANLYMGRAEVIPIAGAASIIDMPFSRIVRL
jgi:hypothetical protein